MDALETLLTRRSIRKFTEQTIPDEDVTILLKCAMLAPSARNEQPWHFVVVTNQEVRDKLSRVTPYTHMAANAPLVIIVCGDTKEDKSGGFWVQDCSAAIENILLAARSMNLGSVWCGIYPKEERVKAMAEILNIPDHVKALGMICIGSPAQPFKEEDRFRPDRIHREHW